jgi:hypothetical protein
LVSRAERSGSTEAKISEPPSVPSRLRFTSHAPESWIERHQPIPSIIGDRQKLPAELFELEVGLDRVTRIARRDQVLDRCPVAASGAWANVIDHRATRSESGMGHTASPRMRLEREDVGVERCKQFLTGVRIVLPPQ